MRVPVCAVLVASCYLALPVPASGGTMRTRATPLGVEEAQGLLADGLAKKRTVKGRIDASNVHVVEEAVAVFEAALSVYEAAMPGGRDEAKAPGLPPGASIDVEGRGHGRVVAFNSYWTVADTHSVEFADGRVEELDLQSKQWTLRTYADGEAPQPAWDETGTTILQELGDALYHLGTARKQMAGGSLTDYTTKPGHAEGKQAADLFRKLESVLRGPKREGAVAQAAVKHQAECYMMMDDFAAARPVWSRYLQYKANGDVAKLDPKERADMLMSFLASHDADEMEFAVRLFDATLRLRELSYDKRNQKHMRVHALVNMRLHELVAHFNTAMSSGEETAVASAAAKSARFSELIEMQWKNMARAFPWRHRTQTPTRFDASIDPAGSPPLPWLDWENDPNFDVCWELDRHKDEIIEEYRAYVGAGSNDQLKLKSVKEWLTEATQLSLTGAVAEADIDAAMEHDSPAEALRTLVELATETIEHAPAQSEPAPKGALGSLFTGNHADISIVGSASAEKWQYLYVKQSGSKGKTGQLEDETCVHFPKTCALLRSLPSVMWMYNATRCTNGVCPVPPPTISPKEAAQPAGVAAFYKLAPGTVVPMHNGPTNQRLKCQLGVDVPPGVRITVGNVTREWRQGAIMAFDDSYHHSVDASQAKATRVVFDISFWHPRLAPSLFPSFDHECWAGGGDKSGDGDACWELQRASRGEQRDVHRKGEL